MGYGIRLHNLPVKDNLHVLRNLGCIHNFFLGGTYIVLHTCIIDVNNTNIIYLLSLRIIFGEQMQARRNPSEHPSAHVCNLKNATVSLFISIPKKVPQNDIAHKNLSSKKILMLLK